MSEPAHHVTVHALDAGWFTMPERFFVTPLENQETKKSVLLLSFLVQHIDQASAKTTRILFDLGLRREISQYSEPILNHVATRQPLSTVLDVVDLLALGGLTPGDIDAVVSDLPWKAKGPFLHTLDMFRDGSVFIVWAPGHLTGHLNLLCRKKGGDYVYLGGDAAYDIRLICGEKDIATWKETSGQVCCIHQDPETARETISRICSAKSGETSLGAVEVILAHDSEWAYQAKAKVRNFPGEI
ncbi:hypothetical protein BFJ63_vAg5641 [Fusarium oxysporum f. sp. narcissi]|uniref:Metallo-beta-lactamase domain-containing protein n=1 Tax=Fusarium oxysporum f. sp. narcissi TaxID=451672 RepID=A0A4Q2VY35_FUSOX|nr:hypothetical protein BFJ63_vAg5641 [Fusarium oxysporum f. sp. narcissi]